jgi:hypothetical protein
MVETFVSDLLHALANVKTVENVSLHIEGVVAKGRVYFTLDEDLLLTFYFNEATETLAFALIKEGMRIWGIDRDGIRGWHRHPLDSPTLHIGIEQASVVEIVQQLGVVLDTLIEHS